jgi:hypothetical protein
MQMEMWEQRTCLQRLASHEEVLRAWGSQIIPLLRNDEGIGQLAKLSNLTYSTLSID